MKDYNISAIEKKWQLKWESNKTFKVYEGNGPKYYVLDMFPYPSGEGLHLGHILCFTATDIIARFKRQQGFNVLHPMGYDAFGLPAEQHAIETGQHPEKTTLKNISNFRRQLQSMGYSYDWDRELSTTDPEYYKWTQWIFIKLFKSWFNKASGKAESITSLIKLIKEDRFVHNGDLLRANEWKRLSASEKEQVLSQYRLAYLSETMVNWCPALGSVLANEEVINGLSERGGFPVEKKLMQQWSLRVTAYADRLLNGLENLEWSESIKEAQRNWIGRSHGVEIQFQIENHEKVTVFTTRPETIYGVTFLAVAPENIILDSIVSPKEKQQVEGYITFAKTRSERERISDTKKATGAFTGAYAINPISKDKIPIYVTDYVLNSYGTGIVMAVPAHDARDSIFAENFGLKSMPVIDENQCMINSSFLNNLKVEVAREKVILHLEKENIGTQKTHYKIRDAIFGRQRYWGEPIPIYYKKGVPHSLPLKELPLVLPELDVYLPTESGDPPLGRAKSWQFKIKNKSYPLELTTMPGWAGSSWYFLRYLDPNNRSNLVDKKKLNYWQNIDLYLGGAEHTTGHLIYFRFWTKFLHDLGYLPFEEPAKKLINQGMILGRSNFVYRIKNSNTFVSSGLISNYVTTSHHVDVSLVNNDILDVDKFRKWRGDFKNAEFIFEDGKYICGFENEKMSKSKHNVVSPDLIVKKYGADTLRMYIMFLGPIELTKPWNPQGIEGISRFLKRVWNYCHSSTSEEETASWNEYKILNLTKKKVKESLENYSFNTAISALMICLNELYEQRCANRAIINDYIIMLAPFAPHLAEELWENLGNKSSVLFAKFPEIDEKYLHSTKVNYPVSINGKLRTNIEVDAEMPQEKVIDTALTNPIILKWLNGVTPRKTIFVERKIINIVV